MTERIRTHPGANLQDSLDATGWSVNEFAAKLGVHRATASRLLHGHQAISPAVALALERIGWSNAEFWMRRQASYDLSVARNKLAKEKGPPSGPTATTASPQAGKAAGARG